MPLVVSLVSQAYPSLVPRGLEPLPAAPSVPVIAHDVSAL
jgi:hypothetical protein